MKVTRTNETVITIEPGDKVRDLYNQLSELPNGAAISVRKGAYTEPGEIVVDYTAI